jgi:thioredoxin reductase
MVYDVIIIGGGPAGLSAGLWLGRCLRKAVIFDHGRPRNAKSHGVHGFFTRDNALPADLIKLGREQLKPYGIDVIHAEVKGARKLKNGFKVTLLNGSAYVSKKLLLATGVTDEIPLIKGALDIYGKSMHHCPYCDGWEWRGKPIGVIGAGKAGFVLSQKLLNWTNDVMLFTNGPSRLTKQQVAHLGERGIVVHTDLVQELIHKRGLLQRVVMANGGEVPRAAIFHTTGQHQRSAIGKQLGCDFSSKGTILADTHERTNIDGVYVAGDASRDMQFVIIAAAEGTKAAIKIHEELLHEEGRI